MHEKLIQRVMKMILSGDDLIFSILRKQYRSAIIKSIECSSVGFFANFEIISNGIEVESYKNQFWIGDICGSVDNLEYAVGFILFVKDGKINMLEGYTNILDFWPQDDTINLSYSTGGTRDYISLRKNWQKN